MAMIELMRTRTIIFVAVRTLLLFGDHAQTFFSTTLQRQYTTALALITMYDDQLRQGASRDRSNAQTKSLTSCRKYILQKTHYLHFRHLRMSQSTTRQAYCRWKDLWIQ